MGTHKWQGIKDWLIHDAIQVPLHLTAHTQRYADINDFVNNPNTPVRTIVGHSLGSAVSSQYLEDHPGLQAQARLYNEPEIEFPWESEDPRVDHYSDLLDPVSAGSFEAQGRFSHLSFPHSFHGGIDL
jgi:pimeloyl-ACP methyl ester carboxylesterase